MSTHDEIVAMCMQNCTPAQWADAVNDFLGSRMAQITDMARASVHRYGAVARGDMTVIADVTQQYLLEANDLLEAERAQPGSVSGLGYAWEAMLKQRGHAKARDLLDREASSTGAVSLERKRRYLRQRRTELFTHLHREPTDGEIVRYANAKAVRDRKDAAKQSMQFTPADIIELLHQDRVSLEAARDAGVDTPSKVETSFSDEFVLHPLESPAYISDVVTAASKVSTPCAKVAHAWLGGYLRGVTSDARDIRTAHEVAELTGMTLKQVYRQLVRVREVARDVFEERFAAELVEV